MKGAATTTTTTTAAGEMRRELGRRSLFQELGLEPSREQSLSSGGTMGMLDREREKASFNVVELTHWWNGGDASHTARRKFIESEISVAPGDSPVYVRSDVPREETIAESITYFAGLHSGYVKKGFKLQPGDVGHMTSTKTLPSPIRINLDLFCNTIRAQGTKEQIEFWIPKALRYEINGAYSQTELGHGSSVRAILTRADFDPKTQEFILNTPVLQACKWWNTGLLCATHAVIAAQLYTNGIHRGLHYFIMQLRDHNMMHLPGINAFDIGQKLGENTCDIGGMMLKDVRIPRDYLLSKQAFVDEKGNYLSRRSKASGGKESSEVDKSSKLKFIPMMQTRVGMVVYASTALAQASTITARYSCVRHQGFTIPDQEGPGMPESAVIDYEIQCFRVLKCIASAYALRSVGGHMREKIAKITRGNLDEAVLELPEAHATISGLKALSTVMTADGIEDLRRACGGHGYLMSSGIAALEADYKGINVTGEGEVTVLMLQTARFLMKSYHSAIKGEPLSQLTSCLEPLKDPGFNPMVGGLPETSREENPMRSLEYLKSLFRFRVLVCVSKVGKEFYQQVSGQGKSFDVVMKMYARRLHDASTAHCQYFLLTSFTEELRKVKDPSAQAILSKLCILFALCLIQEGKGYSWIGLLSAEQNDQIQVTISRLLQELRPDVIPLVDAFDYHDAVLNSAIGCKDDAVYERLYEAAIKSSMNMRPDGSRIHVPSFMASLKPFLDLDFLSRNSKNPKQPSHSNL